MIAIGSSTIAPVEMVPFERYLQNNSSFQSNEAWEYETLFRLYSCFAKNKTNYFTVPCCTSLSKARFQMKKRNSPVNSTYFYAFLFPSVKTLHFLTAVHSKVFSCVKPAICAPLAVEKSLRKMVVEVSSESFRCSCEKNAGLYD